MAAAVYSPMIPAAMRGQSYAGLMHATDWFPTILQMANVSSSRVAISGEAPANDSHLDGVSHFSALLSGAENGPREFVWYNSYKQVDGIVSGDNYTFAIRNNRFKLIHAHVGNPTAHWYEIKDILQDDDDSADTTTSSSNTSLPVLQGVTQLDRCGQAMSLTGAFKKFLYDLQEDPYEETNLYNSADAEAQAAKVGQFLIFAYTFTYTHSYSLLEKEFNLYWYYRSMCAHSVSTLCEPTVRVLTSTRFFYN